VTEPLLKRDREPLPLDATMIIVLRAVAAVAVGETVLGLALFGPRAGLGVAIGGAVAILNMWALARIVPQVLAGGQHGKKWALLGGVKLVALATGGYLLLRSDLCPPIALVLGYGALPFGISIGSMLRPAEQAAAAPPERGGVPTKELVQGRRKAERDHA
jgi:hypothetical protein